MPRANFTSHNRGLMGALRRDEVLLLDKGRDGASTCRPASDFRLRGREEIARVYAEGRIGGQPVLGDLRAPVAAQLADAS
jgi:hypothetical protein